MSSPARVFGLDLLRAAAIFAVLLAHLFAVLYPHVPRLGLLGHGGFFGVELFFVLSGFLIGQILVRTGPNLSEAGQLPAFYLRRWFRTLPLFWLIVVANVALDRWQHGATMAFPDLLGHAFFVRNFTELRLLFMPESWSLAVEEWFYLLFPALLWLGLRWFRKFDPVFLVVAVGFYVFSTAARIQAAPEPAHTWDWMRVIVVQRFDAIMVGLLAAWLSLRFPGAWRRLAWPAAITGAVLVVGMYLTLWRFDATGIGNGADDFFARTWRFNVISLGFALLLPWASHWRLARENPASHAIRRIALWSYAIYLVQHPLSRLILPYLYQDTTASAAHAWTVFLIQLAGSIAVSAALHYLYEAPCTRLREKAVPAMLVFFRKKTEPV